MEIPLREVFKVAGSYLVYVSPQVVGVLVGGFLVQRYWAKKSNESAIIEYLSKQLSDLVEDTLEYWTLDCGGTTKRSENSRHLARKLEPKLVGAIKNINSNLGQYCNKYCKKKKDDFDLLMVDVSDACTGGKFGVAKRAPDPDRFLYVVNTTHRLRWQLLKRRV